MLGAERLQVSGSREELTTDISLHPSNFTADIPSFVNPHLTGTEESTTQECYNDQRVVQKSDEDIGLEGV